MPFEWRSGKKVQRVSGVAFKCYCWTLMVCMYVSKETRVC
jgi:hypothetical protein